jgi:integrase
MGRPIRGSVYVDAGTTYASFSVEGVRRHFRLAVEGAVEAERRRELMASALRRLTEAKKTEFAIDLLRGLAQAADGETDGVLRLVDGVVAGTEERSAARSARPLPDISFREFARKWTSGELHRLFPDHVRDIEHADNVSRLEAYVLPAVGNVRMRDFSIDDAERVMRSPKIPAGSRRHVAQVVHRILALGVYPGRLLTTNPCPRGWLPRTPTRRAMSFLYPSEDLALMQAEDVPLVLRLVIGVMDREGMRKEEAATLEWTSLDLESAKPGGVIHVDENKTDDRRFWALDVGTAEALRRWRELCPSKRYVFPNEAMPGARDGNRSLRVDDLAQRLRDSLPLAGINRPVLFARSAARQRVRAHDLRATFITVHLAAGKSETWIQDRTGHRSSAMINRYRRQARQAEELNLGLFSPLHEAIPELAKVGREGPVLRLVGGTRKR